MNLSFIINKNVSYKDIQKREISLTVHISKLLLVIIKPLQNTNTIKLRGTLSNKEMTRTFLN